MAKKSTIAHPNERGWIMQATEPGERNKKVALQWIAQNSSISGTFNMARLPIGWRLENHGGEHNQREIHDDEAARFLKQSPVSMQSHILVDGERYTIYHMIGNIEECK